MFLNGSTESWFFYSKEMTPHLPRFAKGKDLPGIDSHETFTNREGLYEICPQPISVKQKWFYGGPVAPGSSDVIFKAQI